MEMKNSNTKSAVKIREMVEISLMTAITYLAVSFLHIPYGSGGVVHLGDSIIFITAVLLGTRQAVISGAVGMTMFDMMNQYAQYAPYTFVIKAVMALILGLIVNSGNSRGDNWGKNIIGLILASAWGVAGYYGAEVIMYGNFLTPAVNILGNVIQVGSSAAIAVVLLTALRKTNYFSKR